MMGVLDKVAFHILFGDRKKKIDKFLRTTTPDTVLSDLHACLVREVTTSVAPQAVFSASSIRDSPQKQPYWTKKSFQNHLARTHPDTNIPDTAINVLWSCFCFYAYHPFPLPDASERKLELPAFEQGLILLSFQGTRLLGTVNDDGHGHSWGWSNEPCNCMLRINRIFRGISLIDDQSSSDPHGASYDTLITDDVMQALLPIFPAHPKLFPSLNQLKPLAEHLKGRTDQYQIKLNDLASLVCLIIRLRVHKSTWGRELHYGYFGENSPETEELATILARSFCHGHDEYLAPDSVLRALHILPNLEQCFHQLWAVIFQPCTPTQIPNLESESTPDITLDGILRAVSLFVPPFQAHERTELGRKVNLITFQKQHDWIHSFSDTLDLSHILHQAFLDDPNRRAQLVLFLGHQAQDSKKVVVGAFFPGRTQTPAAEEGKQLEEVENSRISLPQLLFQLQPSFSLFRWNGEANMSSSQLYDSAIGDVDHPNCIGDPKGSKVGVEIDSATRQATFLGGTDTAICQTGGYDEVTRKYNGAEGINANQKERKTKFTVTRIVVFDVEGGPNYDYHWGFGQD